MPNTIMYDAIHDNVASIPANALVVAGYDTGSPDVRWTDADWARFPTKRKVHIDQGFTGSPVFAATVRDVEDHAWTPEAAIQHHGTWVADRPTIYCNLDELPRVLAAGWKGDLWLAIPSDSPPTVPPVVPGCTVVAMQWGQGVNTDLSIVFDPWWPERKPVMTGIRYPAPVNLRETATVSLDWDAVAAIDGVAPTGYTVEIKGFDGKLYGHTVVTGTHITATGLPYRKVFNVRVWANGGTIAPPGVSIAIQT